MALATLLSELLALADAGPPGRDEIRAFLEARGLATVPPESPSGAVVKGRPGDVFLALSPPLVGVRIWEDPRGWGAYAVITVSVGGVAELESVVGPTGPVPRNPDDFHSGPTISAYVARGGKTVRVFAELTHDATNLRKVTLHFQR